MRRFSSVSDRIRGRVAAIVLLVALAPQPGRAGTLYDALGGQPGIDRIVGTLFVLALADDRISETLRNVNVDRLKSRIALQFCMVADGPCRLEGPTMRGAHRGLDITQYQFNALAEDLQAAMDQAGVPFRVQNRLLARLAPLEPDIVTR